MAGPCWPPCPAAFPAFQFPFGHAIRQAEFFCIARLVQGAPAPRARHDACQRRHSRACALCPFFPHAGLAEQLARAVEGLTLSCAACPSAVSPALLTVAAPLRSSRASPKQARRHQQIIRRDPHIRSRPRLSTPPCILVLRPLRDALASARRLISVSGLATRPRREVTTGSALIDMCEYPLSHATPMQAGARAEAHTGHRARDGPPTSRQSAHAHARSASALSLATHTMR